MKRSLLLTLALLLTTATVGLAQATIVDTLPQNKIAILEEFTGVKCVNCPDGHAEAASILAANMGEVFVVAMHPSNSSYTPPYAGEEDFRRSFLDAFYSTPYCGTSRFMPSGFINRREWSAGEKISSRSIWSSSVATIIGESSPLNVGVKAEYTASTNQLSVDVEVYFTGGVSDETTLYVMLTEDSLTSTQSGGGAGYLHKHTFRENLTTAQWGDVIAASSSASDFHSFNFTFDNTTAGYNMNACHVVAYVVNSTTEEIISGNGAEVEDAPVTSVDKAVELGLAVYPNPATSQLFANINIATANEITIRMTDLQGKVVYSENLGTLAAGVNKVDLSNAVNGMNAGLYFVEISNVDSRTVKKVIIQ